MQELRAKAKELLTEKRVNLFIGYGAGWGGRAKAIFVTEPESVEKLIFDATCDRNLAVYLHKPEVKAYGKIGLIANFNALRSVLQLAAENQLKQENLIIITVSNEGSVIVFEDFKGIEDYVLNNLPAPSSEMKQKMDSIQAMDREKRWEYWTETLADCIKCYACRSVCPMCYCDKCTVECNQPQWVPAASHEGGNLEWHLLRAMHLAGRCIGCGECMKACPVGIPFNLLTAKLNMDINIEFGQKPGMKADLDYALSSFKVDDKENFIR